MISRSIKDSKYRSRQVADVYQPSLVVPLLSPLGHPASVTVEEMNKKHEWREGLFEAYNLTGFGMQVSLSRSKRPLLDLSGRCITLGVAVDGGVRVGGAMGPLPPDRVACPRPPRSALGLYHCSTLWELYRAWTRSHRS